LIAPVEMLAGAFNSHLELLRYKILFICGNYSRILSRLNRNSPICKCAAPTPSSSS
jgi:DNA polymerase I